MFLVFFSIDVHALDLVKLPKKEQKVTNRKKNKKSTRLASNRKGNNGVYTRGPHKAKREAEKRRKISKNKNAKKKVRNEQKIAKSDPLGTHQAGQQNTAL